MREEQRDNTRSNNVLTGMVVNDAMIGRVASRWEGEMFDNDWQNTVGDWCVEHWKTYNRAIGRGIQAQFVEWTRKKRDKDVVEAMSYFLSTLSNAWEMNGEYQVDHSYDLAIKHFNYIKVKRLKAELEADLSKGDDERSLVRIQDFAKLEILNADGIKFLKNKPEVYSTFDAVKHGEELIKYRGALGEFFQYCFERDSLVSFVACQKVGKSWWLLDVVYRALLARRRVAYFVVGDMSLQQVKERFLIRASGIPTRSSGNIWPATMEKPTSIETLPIPGKRRKEFDIGRNPLTFDAPLNGDKAWRAMKRLRLKQIRTEHDLLHMEACPIRSVSVQDIKQKILFNESDGWGVPDVLVIDYVDNLKPPNPKDDFRHRINATWEDLSALRAQLHCCLVTATQAKASGRNVEWLGYEHFSEDIRKFNHITAMIGINQMEAEKAIDAYRLDYISRREFSHSEPAYVASCLAIGNPSVKSCF